MIRSAAHQPAPTPSRGIITCILARHTPEALGLGRSLRLNSPGLPSVCVVEGELAPAQLAALTSCYTQVVPLRPEHARMGWLVKHTMIEYSPFGHTLFLDSDCLVLQDLRPAFERAGSRPIAFSTKTHPSQEQSGLLYSNISLKGLMSHFQVDWWPQIVGGGHFFFHATAESRRIFRRAIEWGQPEMIAPFGWTDRKRIAPDELTLQIALVEAGQVRSCAIRDYPFVCWTPWERARPDVFKGTLSLANRETGTRSVAKRHLIAHFGGDAGNATYRRELWRLQLWASRQGGSNARRLATWSMPVVHVYAHALRKLQHAAHRLKMA